MAKLVVNFWIEVVIDLVDFLKRPHPKIAWLGVFRVSLIYLFFNEAFTSVHILIMFVQVSLINNWNLGDVTLPPLHHNLREVACLHRLNVSWLGELYL
jgi:hypothetical protein